MAGLTVPYIDSAQLETDTGRRRISATPDAFGAQQARGAGAVAQGLGQVAEAADQVGQRFDEASALDLDNQLTAKIRDRFYNPDNGYLSTAMGRNAVDQRGQAEADIDGYATALAGQAGVTPRAQQLFLRQARQRVQGALGDIATHATAQTQAYLNQQSEGVVSQATNDAVAAFGDSAAVAANVDRATAELGRMRDRLGWSSDEYAARVQNVRSDINTRVITQMATSDPDGAEAMYARIRPTLTAQDAGELQTAMRVAQREHVDQIEGAGWQAYANGQSLQSLGPGVYRELTTNPLLGAAHARLVNAYQERARSFASGERVRDNAPAYQAALVSSYNSPSEFMRPGALEAFVARNAGQISNGDVTRLLQLRQQLQQNGQDVQTQQRAYNAVRGVAQGVLQPYGIDLTVSDRAPPQQRNQAAAFDAALLTAVQNYLATNGRPPAGEDVQTVIGQAVVGMHSADVQNLPQFRVQNDQGRSGHGAMFGGQAPAIAPTTEAVVPYGAIPQTQRRQVIASLRQRFHRNPTFGEVENEYAAYLNSQRGQ